MGWKHNEKVFPCPDTIHQYCRQCTCGALLGHSGPRTLTRDAPYLTSSPAHHLKPLAQSTMWKKKDWAKTLNPKPHILHTSFNILDWISDVCVMNEFLWAQLYPDLPIAESGILCSPMTQGRYLAQMGLFLQYFSIGKCFVMQKWWQCQFSSPVFCKGEFVGFC